MLSCHPPKPAPRTLLLYATSSLLALNIALFTYARMSLFLSFYFLPTFFFFF